MKATTARPPVIYTLILYVCSLVLFLEWLYPIDEITQTANTTVFMLYTIFCFLISALGVYWWLSFLAKGMGLLFVINGLFFSGSVFKMDWLYYIWDDLSSNVGLLFNQDWYHLTATFRSLLFLVLIWLMSYLLYYWFVTMKYVFVFVALTIIYVSLLDTFTTYDAGIAIIRVVIISLIALGLTNLMKEQARERLRFPRLKKGFSWLVPIFAIILLSVSIGYAAPKFSPQWPDPVPFLQNMADNPGGIGLKKNSRTVGYGEDDSALGGSFSQDDTPIFQAEATTKQYWRIETKDVYTGKGWERSEDETFEEQDNEGISLETFSSDVETDSREADLSFTGEANLKKLIYPYGIESVETDDSAEFLLDTSSELIQTQADGSKTSLSEYTITYDEPSFDVNELKDASESDPDDIKERYTQLPDSLPDRVGDLAEDITESFSNRYDKASAIENYFGQSGFTYQISDVPVPEGDEDYVDQFLYDTKEGYCDNYSTSMIVMLRTMDIPARWVKGFTGGEKIDEKEGPDGEDRGVYEVTNSNAHSWVEVYFPDIGWIPFEPTQGFSNQADFYAETDDADDARDEMDEREEEDEPEQEEEEDSEDENETPEQESKAKQSEKEPFSFPYRYAIIIAVILAALGWFLYYERFRIRAYWYKRKWSRRNGDVKTYRQSYLFLLRLLKHKGLEKNPGQTLREFADRIDRRFQGNDMKQLTHYYEQMVYHKNALDRNTDDFEYIWKRMVHRFLKS